jgi:DNA primase
MHNDINILEILHKYDIPYREDNYSDEVDILCPFHEDHNFGSAKINKKTGLFNCFSCGTGGNVYRFVSLIEGIPEKEVFKRLHNITYDLQTLRVRLKSFSSEPTDLKKKDFLDKMVRRILTNLKGGDINKIHKWIVVCSYLLHNQNFFQDENQLLDFYRRFIL